MKVLLRNTVDLNAFTETVGSRTPYKSTRTSLNFLISVVFYKPCFWISILLSPILILVSDQWSTVATRCMWSGYFCRLCLALRSSASPCLKRLWTAVPCEPQCSTWKYIFLSLKPLLPGILSLQRALCMPLCMAAVNGKGYGYPNQTDQRKAGLVCLYRCAQVG